MMRSVALKLGAGAAAGAASSQLARVSHGDVRAGRPVSLPRATRSSETTDRPQCEDDAWLEVSLREDNVYFGRAEVDEAVEEIVGLCSVDDEGSVEAAADAAIDATNSQMKSSTYMANIMRASQRMVANPGVQHAAMAAIQDDPELRDMISALSNSRIELVDDWSGSLIEYNEDIARRRRRGHRRSPLETMLDDLIYFLSKIRKSFKSGGTVIGRVIRTALSWLWNSVKKAAKAAAAVGGKMDDIAANTLPFAALFFYGFGPSKTAAPFVIFGAMLLVVVMIVKRSIA